MHLLAGVDIMVLFSLVFGKNHFSDLGRTVKVFFSFSCLVSSELPLLEVSVCEAFNTVCSLTVKPGEEIESFPI